MSLQIFLQPVTRSLPATEPPSSLLRGAEVSMDPCPFLRVVVRNLALKVPATARPAGGPGVHPSAHPCFATVRLHNHPSRHTSPVSLVPADHGSNASTASTALAAGFHLSKSDIDRLTRKSLTLFPSAGSGASTTKLKVRVYLGRWGTSCGVRSGRLLGKVSLPLDLKAAAEGKAVVLHSAWIGLGKGAGKAQLYLTVTSEADPKFVFEFDAEPERSPQVFQVQDNRGRQPVFTCSFSCRHNSGDPNWRSKSLPLESSRGRNWPSSLAWPVKERKGWSVTVHDLSGSPVALASMVTPFVASPGTDRVSRSNPGSWLILRPGVVVGTWHPWARLEAWRERGGPSGDGLGYRFELLSTNPADPGVCLAESTISSSRGGKFTVDLTSGSPFPRTTSSSHPGGESTTPSSAYVGFVMSSTIAGEGRSGVRPMVEIGERHVSCAEDAAAFVATAAAVDLSMEACRLFSNKLQRGLSLSNLLRLRRQSSSLI